MTAAVDHGPKPKLQWIPVAQCAVDAKYQRDTGSPRSQNLIAKIVAGFKWSRFGVVLLVRTGDTYSVIDGQHRVEACRALKLPSVPAVVLPHATVAAAAADFVAINRDRVAVTPLHIHHAQLAAGDPIAVEIDRVCRAAGVEICRYPTPAANLKPGQTLAIATIAKMIRDHAAPRAQAILARLRQARGGDVPGAINAAAIRAAIVGDLRLPEASAQRKCLSCARTFQSEGRHQRLCVACRGRSE